MANKDFRMFVRLHLSRKWSHCWVWSRLKN